MHIFGLETIYYEYSLNLWLGKKIIIILNKCKLD